MNSTRNVMVSPPRRPFGVFRPSPGAISVYLVIVIMLITGATFGPLLTASLAHPDDRAYRVEISRPLVWTWSEVGSVFARAHYPPGSGGSYHPLATLSMLVDHRLAGYTQARVFQYHFTNLWLHALNAAMLFLLLRRFSASFLWSFLLALLASLHPAAVETLAGISQRMMVLGTFFSLLALHSFLTAAESCRAGHRPYLAWTATTLFYLAAVLSKSTFVALPILMLLLDLWPLRRTGRGPLVEKLPMVVIGLAAIAVQIRLQMPIPAVQPADADAAELIARNWGSFLIRLVWPSGLSPMYPIFEGLRGWAEFTVAASFATMLLVSWRIHRGLFVGLAGVVVLLGPALMSIPFNTNLIGDGPLYAALIAPLMAIAAALATRRDVSRTPLARIAALCVAGLVALSAVTTFAHTYDWHSPRTLYQCVVRQYPTWSRAHVRLVEACIADNELDAALIHAQKAVEIAPNDPSTQFYLGTVLLLNGDSGCAEAIGPLRRALMTNSSWIECLQNLGVALARSGKLDEAITNLEKARNLAPNSVGIRIALGNAYLQAKRPASARSEFQEALRLRTDPDIHLGLAVAWAANDMPDMARRHLAAAVKEDARMAVRAARYPELLRLRGSPGFAELIDVSRDAGALEAVRAADLETARNAGGS
ncbi:MAG: tetratricopeptide repeat protein [Planctomycetes bacterium]|nr:tetratricopeptide repeat protein [Planctomycetota bacterium]